MRQATILFCVILLLSGCGKTSDEEQIARNLAAIEEAVKAKSFPDIQQYLHDDFLANDRLGAVEARRMLQMYGMQHRRIGVTIMGSNTELDPTFPDRAETTLSVVVTGASGRLPSDGSVRAVSIEWTNEDGNWLIRRANWQR